MSARWVSATVFSTEPAYMGLLLAAIGFDVDVQNPLIAQAKSVSGPLLRLVHAEVPSRIGLDIRVDDLAVAIAGLDEIDAATTVVTSADCAVVTDPDGNAVRLSSDNRSPSPSRRRHLRLVRQSDIEAVPGCRLHNWIVFVRDPAATGRFYRHALGLDVCDAENCVSTIGGDGITDPSADVFFGDTQAILTFFPARARRVTETAFRFAVPDLAATAKRLNDMSISYEFRGLATLVTEDPDGNPVYLSRGEPP
jgi:catechol 2,3-dioxygenase-like lactoylglutathione lyase family enzyme